MPTTTKLHQLAALDEQIAIAKARARTIEQQHGQAKNALANATERLIAGCANQDDEAKLVKEQTAAKARLAEPWPERTAGANRAAERLSVERNTWIHENHAALIAELTPEAHGTAQAIRDTLAALEQAVAAWASVEQRVVRVHVAAGRNGHEIPGTDRLTGALRIFLRDMPSIDAPLPRGTQTISIQPEDDPDPELRAKARQALLQASQ